MEVVIWIVGLAIATAGASALQYFRLRSSNAKLSKADKLECALRVVSGRVENLGSSWHQGTATLSQGRIDFLRGMPGGRGVRPSAKPVSIAVEEIRGQRRPAWREWWSIAPGARVLSVKSGTSLVEWVVLAEQVPVAREKVGK